MDDILNIVSQVHTEAKDKILFLKSILNGIVNVKNWEKVNTVLMYFNTNFIDHVRKEEILLEIMQRDLKFLQEESKVINSILKEHITLIDEIKKINILMERNILINKNEKEEFIRLSNDIINNLEPHIEKEDRVIFPLAQRELKENQLSELTKRINEY